MYLSIIYIYALLSFTHVPCPQKNFKLIQHWHNICLATGRLTSPPWGPWGPWGPDTGGAKSIFRWDKRSMEAFCSAWLTWCHPRGTKNQQKQNSIHQL
jgi:hypothetical protein